MLAGGGVAITGLPLPWLPRIVALGLYWLLVTLRYRRWHGRGIRALHLVSGERAILDMDGDRLSVDAVHCTCYTPFLIILHCKDRKGTRRIVLLKDQMSAESWRRLRRRFAHPGEA